MKPFDFADGLDIWQGDLPHWRQNGVTYFVTFRLADSLPKQKLQELKFRRQNWEKTHRIPYTDKELEEYQRLFSSRVRGLVGCRVWTLPVEPSGTCGDSCQLSGLF